MCDRLHPLIEGLVRTKNLREGKVQGILQQVYFLLLHQAWTEGVSYYSIYPRFTP